MIFLSATVDQAFESLLFGSGSWLGILVILALLVPLLLKWKYAGVLLFPVTLFLGLAYIGESLNYHALIMFFTTVFMLLTSYQRIRK